MDSTLVEMEERLQRLQTQCDLLKRKLKVQERKSLGLEFCLGDCLRNEEALSESEAKYRLLFYSESDAILIFDAETRRILEANPAATNLYGYGNQEFLQLGLDAVTAEPERSHARFDRMIAGEMCRVPLALHRRRNGSVFPAEISSSAFEWKSKKRIAVIIRDITERQEITRLKEDVLSTVSHEMRTPLTAIIGFTEFLLENHLTQEQRQEYLQIIQQESERLRELTENLLDLQSLRAGFGTESFQWLDLVPLLRSVANFFSKSNPGHPIVLEVPENLPPLFGDEKQLYRSLQNLISNAIKYSPAGGDVVIGARREGDSVVLWVRDRGIGIPEEAQERIFERFTRGASETVRRVSGTGLGLSLVKEIAENHKGRIWVESAPEKGSTFYLSFPSDDSRLSDPVPQPMSFHFPESP